MARVKLGSGITSINGSIGGTTYQNSASGTIAKNKGRRTNKSSYQSDKNKSVLSYIQQYWSNMNAADRQQWQDYAVFKPVSQKNNAGRFLNGQQIFALYNYAYFTQFESIINVPVFDTEALTLLTFWIASDGTNVYLKSPTNIDETQYFVIFKISAPTKQSRKRSVGGVKSIYVEFAVSDTVDITAAYTSLFGLVPQVGQYVECEFQIFSATTINWTNRGKIVTEVVTV